MKVLWKQVKGIFKVIDKKGDSLTLKIPVSGYIGGKYYEWFEEQVLDHEYEYSLQSKQHKKQCKCFYCEEWKKANKI